MNVNPDIEFGNLSCKSFYSIVLETVSEKPRVEKIFTQIDYSYVWKSLYCSCVDPETRNISWMICHDVLFVNYFLFNKNICKDKSCHLCGNIETESFIFRMQACKTFKQNRPFLVT